MSKSGALILLLAGSLHAAEPESVGTVVMRTGLAAGGDRIVVQAGAHDYVRAGTLFQVALGLRWRSTKLPCSLTLMGGLESSDVSDFLFHLDEDANTATPDEMSLSRFPVEMALNGHLPLGWQLGVGARRVWGIQHRYTSSSQSVRTDFSPAWGRFVEVSYSLDPGWMLSLRALRESYWTAGSRVIQAGNYDARSVGLYLSTLF